MHLSHFYNGYIILLCPTDDPPKKKASLKISTRGNQSIIEIIVALHPEMEQYITIDELFPFLNRHKILTKANRQKLGPNSSTSPTMKTRHLLEILNTVGPDGEEKFVKALYESSEVSGHKHLIKLLRDEGVNVEVIHGMSTEV